MRRGVLPSKTTGRAGSVPPRLFERRRRKARPRYFPRPDDVAAAYASGAASTGSVRFEPQYLTLAVSTNTAVPTEVYGSYATVSQAGQRASWTAGYLIRGIYRG